MSHWPSGGDNDPEEITSTLIIYGEKQGIALNANQSGQPQPKALAEQGKRTVRHEWPDLYICETIAEAQEIATDGQWTYINERPKMDIGSLAPAQKLNMAA